MFEAVLSAVGAAWEHLLEILWRSDHGGKSLEKEDRDNPRNLWSMVWPSLLAAVVVVLYLAVILRSGGMELGERAEGWAKQPVELHSK